MPTRQQHIEWAKRNERLYFESLQAYERTGRVEHLVDAAMMAYGAQINWLDAGNQLLADRAELWRNSCRLNLVTVCGC